MSQSTSSLSSELRHYSNDTITVGSSGNIYSNSIIVGDDMMYPNPSSGLRIGKRYTLKTYLPPPVPVQDFVLSLLPRFFPKEIRVLLTDIFLESLPFDDQKITVLASESKSYRCENMILIGNGIYAVGCSNCIINRVGEGTRIYLGYSRKIFNDLE